MQTQSSTCLGVPNANPVQYMVHVWGPLMHTSTVQYRVKLAGPMSCKANTLTNPWQSKPSWGWGSPGPYSWEAYQAYTVERPTRPVQLRVLPSLYSWGAYHARPVQLRGLPDLNSWGAYQAWTAERPTRLLQLRGLPGLYSWGAYQACTDEGPTRLVQLRGLPGLSSCVDIWALKLKEVHTLYIHTAQCIERLST
jgi:hypothetical protein